MLTWYILVRRISLQYNIKINMMVDPGWFENNNFMVFPNNNATENTISIILMIVPSNATRNGKIIW